MSAFSKNVARTLSHAITQTYSKPLTQHALTLTALMMRMGGGAGILITDAMFEHCSVEEEFISKGKEKIISVESELRATKGELTSLKHVFSGVKYDLAQKEINWGREMAAAKANAAHSASELASYHKSAREDAEKQVDNVTCKVEELTKVKEDLESRLDEASLELSKANAAAQSALADSLDNQQESIKLETLLWEEREKNRKIVENHSTLEAKVRAMEKTHENESMIINHATEHFQRQQGLIAYINQLSANPSDMKGIGAPPEELLMGEWPSEIRNASSPFAVSATTKII